MKKKLQTWGGWLKKNGRIIGSAVAGILTLLVVVCASACLMSSFVLDLADPSQREIEQLAQGLKNNQLLTGLLVTDESGAIVGQYGKLQLAEITSGRTRAAYGFDQDLLDFLANNPSYNVRLVALTNSDETILPPLNLAQFENELWSPEGESVSSSDGGFCWPEGHYDRFLTSGELPFVPPTRFHWLIRSARGGVLWMAELGLSTPVAVISYAILSFGLTLVMCVLIPSLIVVALVCLWELLLLLYTLVNRKAKKV